MSASVTAPHQPFLFLPGFLPDALPFALRTAAALLLAYGVAFAIQLDTASSAGVCVAIVAQSSPGMALSKAVWRIAGTLVGGVAGIAAVALFAQDRTALLAFATVWLGGCTFVASLLRDFRAYGAVLAGYTVGIVAIGNIDTPDAVFVAALDRVAAILIGVAAVGLVNVVLARATAFAATRRSLAARFAAADSLAARARSGESLPDDTVLAETGAAVLALRTESGYAALELPGGAHRHEAALATIAGLLGMIATSRALGAGHRQPDGPLRAVFLAERDAELTRQRGLALDGLAAMREGRRPREVVRLRAHRDYAGAFINALRTVVTTGLCCVWCVSANWSGASLLLVQLSAFTALLGMQPNPTAAARGMALALPAGALAAGVAGFVALPLASGFVPFALVVGTCAFLFALAGRHPRLAPLGPGLLLYLTLLLAPSNVESFDLASFANAVFVQALAVAFMLLGFRLVLPVDRHRRLARAADAVARDLRRAMSGPAAASPIAATRSMRFDRLAQAQVWLGPPTPSRIAVLRRLCRFAELDAALRRAREGLSMRGEDFPAVDPDAMEARARALLGAPQARAERLAVSGLFEAAWLLRAERRALDLYGVAEA